ncbi:hypothetical protein STENM327S_03127 [Streptomyces tendae]
MSQSAPNSFSKASTVDVTTCSVRSPGASSSIFSRVPWACTEVKSHVGAAGVFSYTVGDT